MLQRPQNGFQCAGKVCLSKPSLLVSTLVIQPPPLVEDTVIGVIGCDAPSGAVICMEATATAGGGNGSLKRPVTSPVTSRASPS